MVSAFSSPEGVADALFLISVLVWLTAVVIFVLVLLWALGSRLEFIRETPFQMKTLPKFAADNVDQVALLVELRTRVEVLCRSNLPFDAYVIEQGTT